MIWFFRDYESVLFFFVDEICKRLRTMFSERDFAYSVPSIVAEKTLSSVPMT